PNWLRINEYINACLPRPLVLSGDDPRERDRQIRESNLGVSVAAAAGIPGPRPLRDQPRYWVTPQGQEVARRLHELQTGAGNTDIPLDYESRKFLAMVDIEAVEFRYVDSLEQVVPRAVEIVARRENRNPAEYVLPGLNPDLQKPEGQPKEAGWLIEIRGYTYHEGNREFLRDTLLYNLNTWWTAERKAVLRGQTPKPAAPPAGGEAAAAAAPAAGGEAPTTTPAADPIRGRLGPAFLYQFWTVPNPVPGQFAFINTGPYMTEIIGALPVTGGDASAGGAGGAGGPGAGGPSGVGGAPGVGEGGSPPDPR